MRVLVTGATGFIGGRVARVLVDEGQDVRVLVRPTSDRRGLPDAVTPVIGDVTKPASLREAAKGVDAVVHLAAMLKQPWHPDFERTNADGVGHLLDACDGVGRVVVVSSVAASGPSPDGRPRVEADPPAPVSAYGRSKLGGEQAARRFVGRVPVTVVRPPVVFGEGDKAMLPAFRAVARGLTATPTMARASLVHVDDLARLCARAITAPEVLGDAPGQGVYFAGCEESPDAATLVRRLGDAVERPVRRVIELPARLVRAAGVVAEAIGKRRGNPTLLSRDKVIEMQAGDWVVSVDKARTQLGWSSAATLPVRLAQTAAWYREHRWL